MKGSTHEGVMRDNCIVDTSASMTNTSALKVSPGDDGFRLAGPDIGNFEWWYFDLIDNRTGCIVKVVVHLGTDPLRRRFSPQLAVTVKTPAKKLTVIRKYTLADFTARADYCELKLRDDAHIFSESRKGVTLYQVKVDIEGFAADFTFTGELDGWKPLGDKVKMERRGRKGSFVWVVPVPRATVAGRFSAGNEQYELEEAIGYHDHNCWEVSADKRLFVDDVISGWYWGRLLTHDCSIVFMKTYLRKHSVTSLMIARGNTIIHSSNNFIDVSADTLKRDQEILTLYPSSITVRSTRKDAPFHMTLRAKEVIEKRDLLDGVHPFIGWLIKLFVSRPAYYGILADCTVSIAEKEIKGLAMYEVMNFRDNYGG